MSSEQRSLDGLRYGYDAGADSDPALTVLFIHGFLDDSTVWDDVVAQLGGSIAAARFDLPGSGSRIDDAGEVAALGLDRFVADAERVIDELDGPVIVVGQSMGSQVAELVAVSRAERVRGLVLVTPVPLAGTGMPDDAIAPFRALGGQAAVQRAVRGQLSPGLSDSALDRLTEVGAAVAPEVVARYADIWNQGAAGSEGASGFGGPVLIVRGGSDGFVTEELVGTAIEPRFARSSTVVVDGGHWLHVEQPALLAQALAVFIDSVDAAAGWQQGFGERSQETFGSAFAEDVVLEASVMSSPLNGRRTVATVLETASGVYEQLDFVAETTAGNVTYLQWKAIAFGGTAFSGVTVLTKGDDGLISHAAIHHRPLSAVLRFSAELRSRLDGVIDTSIFVQDELPVGS